MTLPTALTRSIAGVALVSCAVTFVAFVGLAAQSGSRAVLLEEAPILLQPDARQPLRVASSGTILIFLAVEGDWVRVQFQDPNVGLRTGYVQSKYVRIERPAPPSREVNAVSAPSIPTPDVAPQREAARQPEPSHTSQADGDQPGSSTLSPDAIHSAIQAGQKQRNREQGLLLQDSLSAFGALGSTGTTGFSVVLYTPTTWIQRHAAESARKYQEMTVGDVGVELLEPVLRVIANPDLPRNVTAQGVRGSASVDHVVLQDKSRRITVQPMWTESFDREAANAMGGKVAFKGMNAKFALDDLAEIRGSKGDQEFFVVVIGDTGEEKRFEVKSRHFERLP